MSQYPNTSPNNKKLRKSVWMPLLLLIYLIGMTAWFAPRLIAQGETLRLVVVFFSEIAIIIALRIFLRKRENSGR